MRFIRAACRHGLAAAAALAVAFGQPGGGTARAQIGSDRYAAIVVDAGSGNVLVAAHADAPRHPASLAKMMTLYMVFEALRDGRLSLSTPITISAEAAARPPSKLGLPPGSRITVEQAILALITKSANDVAAAVGEHLSGSSEARFAQMMTLRARSLGMTRTTFRNASGLPDPDQVTTARDMALLGRRLMHDFPERFAYFSTPSFSFRGRPLQNHNRLLQEYEGVDGIKTGYVHASGFNLVASARRDGVRLIAAVFGGASGRERDHHVMALLDQGFARMGVAERSQVGMHRLAAGRLPQPMGAARAAAATPQRDGARASAGRAGSVRTTSAATHRPAGSHATQPRRPSGTEVRAAARPATASAVPQRRGTAGAATPGRRQVEQGDTSRGTAARTAAAPGRQGPAATSATPRPAQAGGSRSAPRD
jgi:D-alanyl-D-alanine carboxypeptidase